MNDIVLSIILVTLLILLLLAGIALSFFMANRQRMRQEQLLLETKSAFEREIRQVEHEVSEHIMSQFARELHDNIGQTLTSIHFEIENKILNNPESENQFKTIQIYLTEATKQLRLLSRTLNNDFIGHSGLYGAIRLEVDRLNELRRLAVQLDCDSGISPLDKDQELMVFRILQEIIQNALRHSGAKHLTISIQSEPFELQVRDDGVGFDFDAIINSSKAFGLRNILKRAQLARLDCFIQTKPGEGTVITLKKSAT